VEVTNVSLKNGTPETLTIEIDLKTFTLLTEFVGSQTWDSMAQHNTALPSAISEFYNMAVGELFNRYWDDGVRGAMETVGV